jgi:hypothetical protein
MLSKENEVDIWQNIHVRYVGRWQVSEDISAHQLKQKKYTDANTVAEKQQTPATYANPNEHISSTYVKTVDEWRMWKNSSATREV